MNTAKLDAPILFAPIKERMINKEALGFANRPNRWCECWCIHNEEEYSCPSSLVQAFSYAARTFFSFEMSCFSLPFGDSWLMQMPLKAHALQGLPFSLNPGL